MNNHPIMTTEQPIVKLTDCVKIYRTGQVHLKALKGVDLTVNPGEMTAIMGPSGSGKSTLMHIIGLLDAMDEGRYFLNGHEVGSLTDNEQAQARNAEIGFVFQSFNLLPSINLRDNVALPLIYAGVSAAERRERAEAMLERVGLLPWAEHRPGEISGGQKQRVAIAGIIAMLPECIVFDESTAMLDPSGRKEVMNTIISLNRDRGITVLHITHNMDEAVLADRVIVMDDGVIYLDGTPRKVFSHVPELQSVGLDVPQVTELLYELSLDGVTMPDGSPLPRGILSEEEGADILRALM